MIGKSAGLRGLVFRARRTTDYEEHVVDYRHVIHALRRTPIALLNLVYRDDLFPRATYARSFKALLAKQTEKQACLSTTTAIDMLLNHQGLTVQDPETVSAALERLPVNGYSLVSLVA